MNTERNYPVAGSQNIPFNAASVKNIFVLFTIFWWIGYPFCAVAGIPNAATMLIGAIVGVPFLTAAVVFACILLYRHWLLLQGFGARTTPGKAVGFSFIPFFCFYWWFIAYAGLAADSNRYMDQQGIQGAKLSYGLAVAMCVVGIVGCLLGWVPIVNIVIDIPCMIIGFLFVLQQKNVIVRILEYRQQEAQQPPAAERP